MRKLGGLGPRINTTRAPTRGPMIKSIIPRYIVDKMGKKHAVMVVKSTQRSPPCLPDPFPNKTGLAEDESALRLQIVFFYTDYNFILSKNVTLRQAVFESQQKAVRQVGPSFCREMKPGANAHNVARTSDVVHASSVTELSVVETPTGRRVLLRQLPGCSSSPSSKRL